MEYIEHLAEVDDDVLLVSAADKLHNARSILTDLREHGTALWGRFTGGRDGSLWYYRALACAYRKHGAPTRLVDELDRVVSEIERVDAELEAVGVTPGPVHADGAPSGPRGRCTIGHT